MGGGAPGISAQILQKEISSLRKELEKKIAGAVQSVQSCISPDQNLQIKALIGKATTTLKQTIDDQIVKVSDEIKKTNGVLKETQSKFLNLSERQDENKSRMLLMKKDFDT